MSADIPINHVSQRPADADNLAMTLRVPEPVDRSRQELSTARHEKHVDGVHSLADALQLVHAAVRTRWGMEGNRLRGLPWIYAWAVDVGPDWVVFRIEMPGATKLMLASYELIGDDVTFGEATEVRRYALYEPVAGELGDDDLERDVFDDQMGVSMVGDEDRIVAAFCRWLEQDGWNTDREVDFVDVVATRGAERIYAEAKGRTTDPGLDTDTLYGQLLRRMPAEEIGDATFAVVVPHSALKFATRVPARVRDALAIRVFGVHDDGAVIEADG